MLVDLCCCPWPYQGFPSPLLPRDFSYTELPYHRLRRFGRDCHQLDHNLLLDDLHMQSDRVFLESRR